jgi:hypothetical protein
VGSFEMSTHLRALFVVLCAAGAMCAAASLSARATAPPLEPLVADVPADEFREPTAEVVGLTDDAVAMRFEAERLSCSGLASVYVRVPDTGAVEVVVGDVSIASLSDDSYERSGNALTPEETARLVTVSDPAVMRDLRLVRVDFSPMFGDDDRYARSVELTLRTSTEKGLNERRTAGRPLSRAFHRLYQSTVLNYDAEVAEAELRGRDSAANGRLANGASYLVISADAYATAIQPLVDWKQAKGVQSRLVTLSETGSTTGEIKSYIQNAYDTWELPPEYVLLVGDTELLPHYSSLTPTDNYYATLEGADFLADVMVGRISCDSVADCETQVAKTFGYERTPLLGQPDWPLSACLMVKDDFDGGDWIYYLNTFRIYDQMEAAGFAPIDTLFLRNDVSYYTVRNSINAGKGFLNFRGQAWIRWPDPFDVDADYTTSGWQLPIVVSATCGTGNYDMDGFICEEWVRAGSATAPQGGVAFFATNTAFPGSEPLSLRRGYVDNGFFDNVFDPASRTLGEACLAGKMKMYLKDDDQIDYEGWNLLGDPELNIWTAEPFELEALHDGGTQVGPSDFVVTVMHEGALYEGAYVALAKDDEVLSGGYTNASGQVSLPIEPLTTGTLTVTVTDKNAVPYEGEALVIDSGPFVVYSDLAVEDVSLGNDDGHLNRGETADIDVELLNIGDTEAPSVTARFRCSDPNITITDSLATYGTIPAMTPAWAQETFEVEVSSGCANGTLVPYSVAVFLDGVETVVLNPSPLVVVTADLVHSVTVCDDASPGGNGDGSPGAGETVGLTLTLDNVSPSGLAGVEATLTSTDPRVSVTTADAPFGDVDGDGTCTNGEVAFIVSISPTATSGHAVPMSLAVTGDGHSYQYSESVEFDIVVTGASVAAPYGPDSYGYYAYDRADSAYGPAPGFDWYDISPPGPGNLVTAITDEDAGVTSMGIFYDVRYYGQLFDMVTINSNGFMGLGVSDYRFGDNSAIPDPHGPPAMLAAFWDDLDPSAGGDIYTWYDLANHQMVYQFDEVRHYGSSLTETFQVIIRDKAYYPTPTGDTEILFLYEDVSLPYGCTVGIESPDQSDGLQWLYDASYAPHAAPIADGAAILFTTVEPVDPDVTWLVLESFTLDDGAGGNGDGLAQPGETISLTVVFASAGGTSAEDVSVTLTSAESMLTVIDGTATLPDIPAGGSKQNTSDELSFSVSEAIPDTVATLWASVSANGGTYTGSGRIDVHIDLSATGIGDDQEPAVFRFRPGYPNPFARDTRMHLMLPATEDVVARVYGPSGRLVKTLVDGELTPGEHVIHWDGTDNHGNRAASGVYFVRLVAGENRASRKVVLLK